MYFYQVDSLMIAMVGMVLFLSARQVSLFPDRSARLAMALEIISWPLAMIVALAVTDAFAPALASGLGAPLFAITYAALALDVIRRTGSNFLAKTMGASISIAVALSFTFSVAMTSTAMTALFSVAAGAMLLLWGAAARRLMTIIAGLVTLGAGVLFGFDAIVQLIITSSWVDLAIFGASAIALGSIIDRHGVALKLRITRWYETTNKQQIALES
jgi:hypothetical protein